MSDKIQIVIFSVLLSQFLSFVIWKVKSHVDRTQELGEVKRGIGLFAEVLKSHIESSAGDCIDPYLDPLISKYAVVRSQNDLAGDFSALRAIHVFLITAGYKDLEARKKSDIKRISEIIDRYSRKGSPIIGSGQTQKTLS